MPNLVLSWAGHPNTRFPPNLSLPLSFFHVFIFYPLVFPISLPTCRPPILLLASLVEFLSKYFIAFTFQSPKNFLSLSTLTFSSISLHLNSSLTKHILRKEKYWLGIFWPRNFLTLLPFEFELPFCPSLSFGLEVFFGFDYYTTLAKSPNYVPVIWESTRWVAQEWW